MPNSQVTNGSEFPDLGGSIRRLIGEAIGSEATVIVLPKPCPKESIGQAIAISTIIPATVLPAPSTASPDGAPIAPPFPISFTATATLPFPVEVDVSVSPASFLVNPSLGDFDSSNFGDYLPATVTPTTAPPPGTVVTITFSIGGKLMQTDNVIYPFADLPTDLFVPVYPRKLAVQQVTQAGTWIRWWINKPPTANDLLLFSYVDDTGANVAGYFDQPTTKELTPNRTGAFLLKANPNGSGQGKSVLITAKSLPVPNFPSVSAILRVEIS